MMGSDQSFSYHSLSCVIRYDRWRKHDFDNYVNVIINGSSRFAPAYLFQSQKNGGRAFLCNSTQDQGGGGAKKGSPKAPDLSAAVQDYQAQHQYAD
jgi:hypothetical protein